MLSTIFTFISLSVFFFVTCGKKKGAKNIVEIKKAGNSKTSSTTKTNSGSGIDIVKSQTTSPKSSLVSSVQGKTENKKTSSKIIIEPKIKKDGKSSKKETEKSSKIMSENPMRDERKKRKLRAEQIDLLCTEQSKKDGYNYEAFINYLEMRIEMIAKYEDLLKEHHKVGPKKFSYGYKGKGVPEVSSVGVLVTGYGNGWPDLRFDKKKYLDDSDNASVKEEKTKPVVEPAIPIPKLSSTDLAKRGVASAEPINDWNKHPPVRKPMEETDVETSAVGGSPTKPVKLSTEEKPRGKLVGDFYDIALHRDALSAGFSTAEKKGSNIKTIVVELGKTWPDYDWNSVCDNVVGENGEIKKWDF